MDKLDKLVYSLEQLVYSQGRSKEFCFIVVTGEKSFAVHTSYTGLHKRIHVPLSLLAKIDEEEFSTMVWIY